jgi:hypothetical protein
MEWGLELEGLRALVRESPRADSIGALRGVLPALADMERDYRHTRTR